MLSLVIIAIICQYLSIRALQIEEANVISLVENSGDHYLGKYRRGRLHGLVTETLDFSDFHNISREVFYEAI